MTHPTAATAPRTDWSAAIRPRRIGHTIEVHDLIGSTNDRAWELLADEGGDGAVVLAEEQSAGRGRRGREWLSPPGVNLTLSAAVRPDLPARSAWQLGLATALATFGACREVAPGVGLGLKWPNDVVAGSGAKVAGLLLETIMLGDRLSGAVLGIGINVNWRPEEMPAEIADRATSLLALTGAEVDRVVLLGRLLDRLDAELLALESGRTPLPRYRSACITLGQEVSVELASTTVAGRAVDLDETGSLLLDTPAGRLTLPTGEVVALRGEPHA